jgi:hypothetical protein
MFELGAVAGTLSFERKLLQSIFHASAMAEF